MQDALNILAHDLYRSNFYAGSDYKFMFATLGINDTSMALAHEVAMRKLNSIIDIMHEENVAICNQQREAENKRHDEIISGYKMQYHRCRLLGASIVHMENILNDGFKMPQPGMIFYLPPRQTLTTYANGK